MGTGDTLNAEIRILEETELMEEVTVAAERYNKNMEEQYLEEHKFYFRKKRGLGQFFTREAIQKKNLFRLSDLLRATPGIIVRNGQIWSARAKCPMKFILNGMEMFNNSALMMQSYYQAPDFSIDRLVNVDNVLAVEVYTGQIGQPQNYGSKSRCGAVLVWTR